MKTSPALNDRATRLQEVVGRSAMKAKIVELLVAGYQRKQIAARLGRSVHTVNDHIKELYRIVGVTDRVLLAQIAMLTPPQTRGF